MILAVELKHNPNPDPNPNPNPNPKVKEIEGVCAAMNVIFAYAGQVISKNLEKSWNMWK